MDKSSELDCYLYYMWNVWHKGECIEIFGQSLGQHIWSKWSLCCEEVGLPGAPASLYAVLDIDNRRKVVARAIAYYNS